MKSKNELKLPPKATLKDYQKYVMDLEKRRGFLQQTAIEKCLMLGEEVGELFKAVRKKEGLKVDKKNSKFKDIPGELADIFIFILSISNKFDIDLEKAFINKEAINKKRIWN
ncbi:pyrophosphohydrolase [Candidatus Dojkabacteria bacterium]|nr:pyrophosphohydrolase [Candidatus Dojkabacteria bacterium]